MKRKKFIATLLGGLVAAPVVAKAIVESKPAVFLKPVYEEVDKILSIPKVRKDLSLRILSARGNFKRNETCQLDIQTEADLCGGMTLLLEDFTPLLITGKPMRNGSIVTVDATVLLFEADFSLNRKMVEYGRCAIPGGSMFREGSAV